MRALHAAALVALLPFAGCLGGPEEGAAPGPTPVDHDGLEDLIGAPIEIDHDHTDARLHQGSVNLRQLSWSPLGITLGEEGFANFVFHVDDDETLAFVAIDGDLTGGFVIVDVADPLMVRVLGRYSIQGSGIQEVRVTPDGRYAIMNVQEAPRPDQLVDLEGMGDCSVCIHVVDVSDRAAPRLSSVFPVDVIGTHNMMMHEIGGVLYVFYVGQSLNNAPPGNYVGIARFVEGPAGAALVKVSEYRHVQAAAQAGRSFPHDAIVATHPLTGQEILYVAHWEGGAITVDVSDPMAPRELDVDADAAPSEVNAIHWFAPEPVPRGDRLIAWSAPEIATLASGSGVMRAYDVTDPAGITQIGWWDLPGDVTIPGQFIFSPHIVDLDVERGLLAVSHYHAGVWVLDATDPTAPRHLAYHMPVGDAAAPYVGPYWWKKPNFDPAGYLPNVFQARWKDDLLWVTERGTGLYVLEYTGPVPGPVA